MGPASRAGIVLITRPEPGGHETAGRLRERGYTSLIAPCLAITPRPVQLPEATRLQAILITSGQAVAALPASLHRTQLLAVGDATAARARAAGFGDVHSAGGDAAALASLTIQLCRPANGALLLACGAHQGIPLAASLRAAGFKVLRRAAYKAVPATRLPAAACAALADGTVSSVLFFSTTTARSFARLLPEELRSALAGAEALAMAPPVAAAVQYLPWRAVRVALRPTQEDLLALLS